MKITNETIYRTLDDISVSPNILGYEYIVDALHLIFKDSTLRHNIVLLYSTIGKAHNATSSSVERCIRYAIQTCNHQHSCLKNYKKLTNSKFLCILYYSILNELES